MSEVERNTDTMHKLSWLTRTFTRLNRESTALKFYYLQVMKTLKCNLPMFMVIILLSICYTVWVKRNTVTRLLNVEIVGQ